MHINNRISPRYISCTVLLGFAMVAYSSYSFAWGSNGHAAIGILAMSQLKPGAYSELEKIVGPLDEQAMMKACNWPDNVRETEEWEWSSPQHYVNIPRGDFTYLQSRDCPDGLCATEAVKKYAIELTDDTLSKQQRWQAFAWLCHVTADLHQPLHAGFGDDRGGNNFDVVYKGEEMNLHGFWDHELLDQHADSWQELVSILRPIEATQPESNWSAEMVNEWTNDSHNLAKLKVYPPSKDLDETYVQKSWKIAQQQLSLAASRLALIINSQLQD